MDYSIDRVSITGYTYGYVQRYTKKWINQNFKFWGCKLPHQKYLYSCVATDPYQYHW